MIIPFKHGNWTNNICPICKTKDDGEVVLIPIVGTQEGHNAQAVQVHVQCIFSQAIYDDVNNAIYVFAK